MLTRRGFLQTMLATAVGAVAHFDPLRGLWVPGTEAAILKDGVPVTIIDQTNIIWTKAPVDVTLELNDLALRFVKEMGARLSKASSCVLRQVMLQRA